jgi:CHAT domain-containing protein/tetratricopeptide (TPR) repeat protein
MRAARRLLIRSAPALLVVASLGAGQPAQRLTLGQTIDAELKGGGVDRYEVDLTAGMYFAATFDQRGGDVRAVIIGPDGRILYDYDGSEWGWEPALAIAPTSGVYRLEARSPRASAATGWYQLHVDAIRIPTAEDEARIHIARLQSEGLAAFRARTPDSGQRARELLEQALTEWRRLGDKRGEAHVLRALSYIANNLEDFPAQADYSRLQIALRRELGDEYGEADAWRVLSIALNVMGESDAAREALTRSLTLDQAAGRVGPAVDALAQLARIARRTGEFGLALEQAYQALALSRRLGDKQREASALAAVASIHLALGEFETAIDVYRGAEAGDPDPPTRAQAASNIGLALAKLGDFDAAERLIKESLAVWAARGWGSDGANALNSLGELYAQRGDLARARDSFEQAAAKSAEAKFVSGESLARRRLGEVLLQLGRLDEADQALAAASALAARDSEPIAKAVILADAARLALARGDAGSARRSAEQAVSAVESVRGRAESARIRAAMLASSQSVYEALVRVLMTQHEADPSAGLDGLALEISERARACSLLDLVMDVRGDSGGGSSTALDELQTLQRRIHAKAQAADDAQRAKRSIATSLGRELDELLDRYGLVEARLKREHPDAATVADPELLSADAIQHQVLDRDTVLIEYMLAEPASYAWVVSQHSVVSHRLAGRSTIEAAAQRFQALVAKPPAPTGAGGRNPSEVRASATALARLLLEPAGKIASGKRLLIVAPGSLQQVPFAALPEGAKGEPLIAHHEIVHAPSASIVAAVRSLDDRRRVAPRALAVFADPVFDAMDPRVAASRARLAGRDHTDQSPTLLVRALRSVEPDRKGLARLPFTRLEADAISAVAPHGSVLKATDFSANLRLVTRPSLADYRILHFATHGLLDTRTPELSGLVFSLVDAEGRAQDGFLRLNDIRRLRLNAELAVLSGCDTGRGRSIDGEGVIGLTRGFVIAGARRVVASLWQVDDLATAELMKRFYREMFDRGQPPTTALAIAQRQMAESARWQNPYFWAGFVIQGEWRTRRH